MAVQIPPAKIKGIELPRRGKHKSWYGRFFPYLAWQVLAILIAELVLFWAGLGEEEIYKLNPELGFEHFSNKRITWRQEGYAQSYFNENGMRESGLTLVKPANIYRIALLGDSMVEGLQVPLESTFGQILERKLNKQEGHKVQVLNFGTSGYSTTQEYLQLKSKVLKYQPDLVILCYNSRDIFENWSPPDEVITNVRPLAVHLPGGSLVVNSYPVTRWMKSPRARFLKAIEWIRQNSRIWGLLAATELELSFHNPVYKTISSFVTEPNKALKELRLWLKTTFTSKPSFQIQTFESIGTEGNAPASPLSKSPATADLSNSSKSPSLNSAAPNKVLEKSSRLMSLKVKPNGNKVFLELLQRTLESLLREMKNDCQRHNAKFIVITAPVRAALCPEPGMDTQFYYIDYQQEISMLTKACKTLEISLVDCQSIAERLSKNQQASLFYYVHLNPVGHEFLANVLYPQVKSIFRQ